VLPIREDSLISSKGLAAFGVEIISTGGTAKALRDGGITVVDISDYTGFPEMMDGRLKTLHPKVHGGMLAMRDNPEHVAAMKQEGIKPIDMLVVNLYRFEDTVAKGASLEHAIENIDIGGPAMVRAASKNYRFVSVVTDPADYGKIIDEMKSTGGSVSEKTNFELARNAFSLTARYDAAISNHLQSLDIEEGEFPLTYTAQYKRRQIMRYGENPHQKAAFYTDLTVNQPSLSTAQQLWGKELSYNNIMDADAALDLIMEFEKPACVILKHSNPCGAAQSETSLAEAYTKAFNVDKVSAFGGIVGLNRPMDAETAKCHRRRVHRGGHRARLHEGSPGHPHAEKEHPAPEGARDSFRQIGQEDPCSTPAGSWAASCSRTATWATSIFRRPRWSRRESPLQTSWRP
jgi:phosphoribosylaminoimidazolecarboxamide formyltransferase / IMP cyclohydrolase